MNDDSEYTKPPSADEIFVIKTTLPLFSPREFAAEIGGILNDIFVGDEQGLRLWLEWSSADQATSEAQISWWRARGQSGLPSRGRDKMLRLLEIIYARP